MPSSMIHLNTARLYRPDASTLFLIGSLAPDAYNGDWRGKDITHLRDREDRLYALAEYARAFDMRNDFYHGAVMHLYLDYYWDKQAMEPYKAGFTDLSWVTPYKHEIDLASSWLYNHLDWSESVWDDMVELIPDRYDTLSYASHDDIVNYLRRNRDWHRKTNYGPSEAFPVDYVDRFCELTAVSFKGWIKNN